MNMFHLKIGAIALLAVLATVALQCAAFSDDTAMCMRSNVIDLGLWLLHWSTLGAAIWLGIEAAKASKRDWLGWVAGLIVLVALNFGLNWMGFTLPEHEPGDGTDNSYRR